MPTFLVMHQLMGIELTNVHSYYIEVADTLTRAVEASGAQFQQCWYDSENGLLVCEWRAEEAECIRKVLKSIDFPVESIHEVTRFSAQDLIAQLPSEVS